MVAATVGCGRRGFESRSDGGALDSLDAPACEASYLPAPGLTSRYRLAPVRSFREAELDCESDGGHLPMIDSDAENTWLSAQIVDPDVTWIGATDSQVEGTFRWLTGELVTSPRWAMGEPNDINGLENCVEMFPSGEWNDERCELTRTYFCECDHVRPTMP